VFLRRRSRAFRHKKYPSVHPRSVTVLTRTHHRSLIGYQLSGFFSGLSWFYISSTEWNEHSFRAAKSPEIVQLAEFLIYPAVILCKIQRLNTRLLLSCEILSSHGGEYDVQNCLLGCTASISSLMMEAVRTSETSVDNYFTRQYIPEDNSELLLSVLCCCVKYNLCHLCRTQFSEIRCQPDCKRDTDLYRR
jgi:hypothetical protein